MLLRTRDRFVRAMGAAGVCVALWGCKAAPIVGDDPDAFRQRCAEKLEPNAKQPLHFLAKLR